MLPSSRPLGILIVDGPDTAASCATALALAALAGAIWYMNK